MGIALSKEQVSEIIEKHKSGKEATVIALDYNIHPASVRKILRKNGISLSERLKEETIDKAIELYNEGISSEKIAKLYNVSATAICRNMKKKGVKLVKTPSKYAINDDLFDNIDTEEKAYFLGYMWADGNVRRTGDAFKMTLHKQDEEILHKFLKMIYKSDYNLYDKGKYCGFYVSNRKLTQKLIEFGCHPNKTHTVKFPEKLDKLLYRHFIRGLFDGDGCIYSTIKYKKTRVSYTGSVLLCEELISILNDIGINKVYRSKRHKECNTIMTFDIGKIKLVKDFLHYIYKDSTIYLQRKYNKYLKFISDSPYSKDIVNEFEENIENLNIEDLEMDEEDKFNQ